MRGAWVLARMLPRWQMGFPNLKESEVASPAVFLLQRHYDENILCPPVEGFRFSVVPGRLWPMNGR